MKTDTISSDFFIPLSDFKNNKSLFGFVLDVYGFNDSYEPKTWNLYQK